VFVSWLHQVLEKLQEVTLPSQSKLSAKMVNFQSKNNWFSLQGSKTKRKLNESGEVASKKEKK
jgi:hypothetical protein